MNLYTEKFNAFCCKAICLIMCAALGFFFVISLLSTTFITDAEIVFVVSDKAYLHMLVIPVFLGILSLLREKSGIRLSERGLLILGILVIGLLFLYTTVAGLYPRFDQRHVLQVAEAMIQGDYTEYKPGGYAEIYPYQNGLILYYSLFARLFGSGDALAIQYMNLVCIALIYTATYLILKKFTVKTGEEKYCVAAMLLFIPFWGYVTFVYGNVPALTLGIWGVYFSLRYLERCRMQDALIAGILLGCARVFKINIMIISIAVCIAAVMEVIRDRKWKKLILVLLVLVFSVGSGKAVDAVMAEKLGHKVTEGIPALPYVAMGLHEQIYHGAGWHDNYPENTYEELGNDADAANEAAKEDIKASVQNFKSHPGYAVGFVIRKLAHMWNEPSYDSLSMQMNRSSVREGQEVPQIIHTLVDKGSVNHGIYLLMNYLQTLVLFGALCYFLMNFQETDLKKYIFAMFFIGGLLFHLVWEASSQYAIFYMLFLVPYSGMGFIKAVRSIREMPRRRLYLLLGGFVLLCLVLSVPKVCSILTLNRGTELFYQYLAE